MVEPILFDLKDGTLKRVAKSNYKPNPTDAITEIDSDFEDEPNQSELSSQNFSGEDNEDEQPDDSEDGAAIRSKQQRSVTEAIDSARSI